MKIKAKVVKMFDTGSVKAICDVTLDDEFAIHGVKLIKGQSGTFVAMPTDKWKNTDGETKYSDIVHPTKSEARSELFKAVSDAYNSHVQSNGNAPTQEMK